jgi:hypothetical protein
MQEKYKNYILGTKNTQQTAPSKKVPFVKISTSKLSPLNTQLFSSRYRDDKQMIASR